MRAALSAGAALWSGGRLMDETKRCPACGALMRSMSGVVVLVHSAFDLPFSRELRWICDAEDCRAAADRRAAS